LGRYRVAQGEEESRVASHPKTKRLTPLSVAGYGGVMAVLSPTGAGTGEFAVIAMSARPPPWSRPRCRSEVQPEKVKHYVC